MWRSGSGGKEGVMAGGVAAGQVVAVAVDAGKSSQQALKWAADHVLSRSQIFFLLHVRNRITLIPSSTGHQVSIDDLEDEVATAFTQDIDFQTKELLLPFQCFCSRRGLQCKEVILDNMDVPKAIIDFIKHQNVDKIVMGVSSRNALTRTFKAADVPTSVSKLAPEFCSVYVVSKGKITSIRPAIHPNSHPTKPVGKLETAGNQFQSIKSEPEIRQHNEPPARSALQRGARVTDNESKLSLRICNNGIAERINKINLGEPNLDYLYQSISSCPSPSRTSIDCPPNYHSQEYSDDGGRSSHSSNMGIEYAFRDGRNSGGPSWSSSSGFSIGGHSPRPRASWSSHSMENIDDEIRRLKRDLKHTLEMYEGVHKEADTAQHQAHYKKADEELEAAMEMTERERRRAKPVPESSPVMQKKIETETLTKLIDAEDGLSPGIQYRRYTMEEIQKATDNFSDALKIGEGGYGPVYRSTLDHTLVAIKILQCDANHGIKQFQKEVEVLSYIRHPNMVLLMGACPEYGCLVYEFMANGSLEDCLFSRNNTPPLSWQQRFKIAAEIATGLLFLHQTKPEPVVHRDLKPANVLLDHNYVSKIADVGLARLLPQNAPGSNSTRFYMTAAAGTFCYIDPEYERTGMVGITSDIYAFGIILLQLITGAPPMALAHKVEKAMEAYKLEDMLDTKVTDWPMEETIKFAKLALKCAELRHRDRPDLATVVLPTLNRLRAFADSRIQVPWVHRLEGSRIHKESSKKSETAVSEIRDDGPVSETSLS